MTSSDRYEELLKSIANEKQKSTKSETTKNSTSDPDKIKNLRSQNKIRGRVTLYCLLDDKSPNVDQSALAETIRNLDKESSHSDKND